MNPPPNDPGRSLSAGPPHDEEWLYEFVGGRWIAMPPLSPFAGLIATRLMVEVARHAVSHDLGEAVAHMLFAMLPQEGRYRRPEMAFVSYQRWPKSRSVSATEYAWDVIPELAAEVVGPTEPAEDLLQKVSEYFRAGVRLVWVFYPRAGVVYVYESLTQVRGLRRTDELDGGDVLPGLKLSLAAIFGEEETPDDAL